MLATVDFEDQADLVAQEIGNVPADRHLAAELVAVHLTRAQYLPEPFFRLGRVAPQRASSRVCAVDRMLFHVSDAGRITPTHPSPIKGEGSRPALSRCRRSGP